MSNIRHLTMEKAIKTARLVKEEIESNFYVQQTLKKGLINYSELARQLLLKIKQKNKKANFSSVLIAIQRYYDEIQKSSTDFEKFIKENIPNLELIIKNNIITLSYERTKKVMSVLNEISKQIQWHAGDIMFIVQGTSEITIIVDKKNKNKFDKLKKELLEIKEDLTTLSIREPEGKVYSKEIPGFLALLTSTLANKNINIYELVTTFRQEIFVIHKKEITKAYEAINDLIEFYGRLQRVNSN